MIDPQVGARLVRYARARVREALGGPPAHPPDDPIGAAPGAAFVTLRRKTDGRLHGCIGSLEPRRPLVSDVAENAVAAALEDPRAPTIELEDVDDLEVELSVLSPLEKLPAAPTEREAFALVDARRGGIVLRWHGRRATFLPQMWDRMTGVREFLDELRMKAGLAPDFWAPDVELYRYTVEEFHDP